MKRRLLSVVLLLGWFLTLHADDWPQWRGSERTNVSKETGLAESWPAEGPRLLWKATGLGDGVAPVSVVMGRIFTTGNVDEKVICTALSEKEGKRLWSKPIGPAAKEMSIMRWLSQSSPTVDTEFLYVVTANGDYVCLTVDAGKEQWRKHHQKDYGGKRTVWGYCDYPLIDGDRVILTPGGSGPAMVALNKKTGETIWSCSSPVVDMHSHAMLVPCTIAGVRQYVHQLAKTMIGVSAEDGKLLWHYSGMQPTIATTHAPVIRDNHIFYASGYSAGNVQLQVSLHDGAWKVAERYRQKARGYLPWLGCPTPVEDGVLLNVERGLQWMNWKTGEVKWEENTIRRCMFTVADQKVFVRSQQGKVILGQATPQGWKVISEFTPPPAEAKQPAFTFPVVANGRLYIRNYDTLLCYDITKEKVPKEKPSDAVFVPTPSDVVDAMLKLAQVGKKDRLFDLGSGDGRIVIAAAKAGCQAVGVEIEEELVRHSREAAREASVEKLATFVQGDLFTTDFSSATVVALYILPEMSAKLIPKFNQLQPGSRVVSHCFAIPGIVPDQVFHMKSKEDDIERAVYLYRIPLKQTGK